MFKAVDYQKFQPSLPQVQEIIRLLKYEIFENVRADQESSRRDKRT